MKIQRLIFWFMFIVIVVLLIALALWHGRKLSAETPLAVSVASSMQPAIATNSPISTPVQSNVPTGIATNVPVSPPANTEPAERSQLSELNDEQIVFYGRVVDQFGSPVVNAKIAASIRVNSGTRVGVDRFSLATDENGSFTINGYKGETLGIWIAKNGYVMATTHTLFIYSYLWPASQRYTPDQNNPTVIQMWKLQGAEPLMGINQHYKLHYTNAPINFDLLTGQIVPSGGDIEITVNRPAGNVSEHNPQNWNIGFAVVNGGYIEASDDNWGTTYAAPGDGYQLSGAFTNNNGPGLVDRAFFIESRNGQIYSKIHLLFGINPTQDGFMDINFTGVANTNSSRNWEATAGQ